MIFKKIKGRLGGRIRQVISGAAPLSPETAQFLKICFGCPVLQGYGLTETTSAGTVSDALDLKTGHVGPVIPSVEIKLVDIPDMNYFSSKGEGEVWIRGPSVTLGYYKDEKKTAEDFDADGWFHTGDVGRWNANGTLSIIDRKKNMFKLAQGEYVAAEKLELIYARSRFVGQIWIYGDSNASCIIAVVSPEVNFLNTFASEKNIEGDLAKLCENEEVKKAVLSDFELIAKEAKVAGFEVVKGVILSPIEWLPATELVTPTLKLKRPQLRDKFYDEIVALYAKLGEKLPPRS